jgi:hypothetical protein
LTPDDEFSLDAKYHSKLEQLLIEIVKYYLIKGAVHNSVNPVKDTTFRVCAAISAGKDEKAEFDANITESDKTKLFALLKDGSISGRYLRGFVILASYLNPGQNKEKFAEMLWTRYDIEHILPKQWNHYDGWTKETHESHLNLLGNLIPLERAKNIKAQNEYLRKKKELYMDSVVQDARDMDSVSDNGWIPDAVEKKHYEKVSRLTTFFSAVKL